MGCGECCRRFCSCCCSCLSRIPYGTTIGVAVSIIGMLVFVGGFVTSLKSIDKMANIKGALDFGYTVTGVIVGASVLLGILIFLFACCTSGDTRDNVYSGWKSKLFGKCFSSLLIIIEYLLYLAWSLLSVFMVVPVLLQIMLSALCAITPKCINLHNLGLEPFLKFAKNKTINTEICADELKEFCSNVKDAGTPLIVTLCGTLIAALGTVHVLMCLSSNFAYVKSHRKSQKNGKGSEAVAMT